MWADWTRVRFLPQKRRLFVFFLNLSPRVVPQPSWLTSLVMQTYGGGEWWSLSLTFPSVEHTEVVWVWGNYWTCCTNLYLIPACAPAMISCLSMKFQETRPWQQTLQDTPWGDILCWKHVCYVSIGTLRLNQVLNKKGILSLFSVPGKLKLPEGKKILLRPPFSFSKLPFISLELPPPPFHWTLIQIFTQLSVETHLGLAML